VKDVTKCSRALCVRSNRLGYESVFADVVKMLYFTCCIISIT